MDWTTEGILSKFNMHLARKVSTPVNVSEKLMNASEESEMVDKQLYQSAVGSLLIRTKGNIL